MSGFFTSARLVRYELPQEATLAVAIDSSSNAIEDAPGTEYGSSTDFGEYLSKIARLTRSNDTLPIDQPENLRSVTSSMCNS